MSVLAELVRSAYVHREQSKTESDSSQVNTHLASRSDSEVEILICSLAAFCTWTRLSAAAGGGAAEGEERLKG